MRIVSGKYGGRVLEPPKDQAIRPTSDKVRGAIFNSLRSRITLEGAHVIDCFCGTGAMGIEALSQGAAYCIFVDQSKSSVELAKRNVRNVGALDHAKFLLKDITKLKPSNVGYNLAFIDPPYKKDLIEKTLNILQQGWLIHGSICVIESEKNFCVQNPSFETLSEKIYGDTKVTLAHYRGQ